MIELTSNFKNEYIEKYGLITSNSKIIKCNNELVGIIDYIENINHITILYITIQNKFKNKGIAAEVINMLKKYNKPIYGDSVPASIKFWEKMGAKFIKDEEEDYLIPFIIN